ncbi:MAG: hypothetical protein ABFD20_02535 [Anaerolineales bacterium]
MTTRSHASLWWLALPFCLVLVLTLALTLPRGVAFDVYSLARIAALLGYQLVFLSVLSSALVRPLVKTFGRPFIGLHHILAISGLVCLAAHAALVNIAWGESLPEGGSLADFLHLAGEPALGLFVLAALGAVFRKRLKGAWPVVHALTYVAFLLGTIHATTAPFTTDLQSTGVRVVAWLMALVVVGVFVARRTLLKRPAPASRRSR